MPRKKTHEEFVSQLKEINPNIEVLGEYVNNRTKLLCKCKVDGHEWNAIPTVLTSQKSGCPKCAGNSHKTHKDFLSEICIKNPNVEVLEEYINNETKILCRCKIDGYEWYTKPGILLNGHSCPKCAGVVRNSHEEFLKKLYGINPDIEALGKYTKSSEKILCKCKICGYEWNPTPNSLQQGSGCPKCAGLNRKSTKEFIEELYRINTNIEVLGEYLNNNTYIKCRCRIDNHGWHAYPSNLLKGKGCPICGFKRRGEQLSKSHDAFIKELRLINPDIKVVGKYINSKQIVAFKCKVCNKEWSAIPSNILRGTGCPSCNKSKGENRIEQYLKENNVEYSTQHKYNELVGIGGRRLSYDFYLPKINTLIEYQGNFHDGTVNGDFQTQSMFEYQQEHDKRKRKFAKQKGINLLEIWYYDFDNIEEILSRELGLVA